MAPAVTLDTASDFNFNPTINKMSSASRTLLLAPPSVAAHPELLDRMFEAHDRRSTDIQMLDRLALGLVSLPASTYDIILLLTDADGTRTESQKLLGRDIMDKLVQALKAGGKLRSQDEQFGATEGLEKTEAILAGLVDAGSGDGMIKPEYMESQSVPLRFGKKANTSAAGTGVAPANGSVPFPSSNGKRKSISEEAVKPNGVGFVDFSDDLEIVTGEDDELIDEDDLLTEADMARPVVQRRWCHFCCRSPANQFIQRQNAGRKQESADERAKTAHAV